MISNGPQVYQIMMKFDCIPVFLQPQKKSFESKKRGENKDAKNHTAGENKQTNTPKYPHSLIHCSCAFPYSSLRAQPLCPAPGSRSPRVAASRRSGVASPPKRFRLEGFGGGGPSFFLAGFHRFFVFCWFLMVFWWFFKDLAYFMWMKMLLGAEVGWFCTVLYGFYFFDRSLRWFHECTYIRDRVIVSQGKRPHMIGGPTSCNRRAYQPLSCLQATSHHLLEPPWTTNTAKGTRITQSKPL